MSTIQDLEDNYPEYLDDALGYAYSAWDATPEAEVLAHDRVLFADSMDGLDPAGLSDLERWAYARRAAKSGDTEAFVSATEMILASKEPHPALAIEEIYVRAIDVVADAQRFDEADEWVARLKKAFPEYEDLPLIEAILVARQDAGRGHVALEKLVASDIDDETWIDLVSELLRIGRRELALTWISLAKRRLTETKNRTGLVDIRLLENQLKRA